MAGSVVAAASIGGGTTTLTCALPTGTASGDVMVAFQSADYATAAAMTAPAGWTLIGTQDQGTNLLHTKIWTLTAGASEPASYAFAQGTNADGTVVIVTTRGTTAPAAGNLAMANIALGGSRDAPSLTGVAADAVLLCGATTEASGATAITWPTPPAGMTTQASVQSQNSWASSTVASLLNPPATTGAKTFTPSPAVTTGPGTITWSIAVPSSSKVASGSALAAARLAASSTTTGNHAGAPTATARLATTAAATQARSGSPPAATARLVASATGGKDAGGSATATALRLVATATGAKVNLGVAVVRLSATIADVLHAGLASTGRPPATDLLPGPGLYPSAGVVNATALRLAADTSLNSRTTTPVDVVAVLVLRTTTTATSDRANSAAATALYISAEPLPAGRIITAITTQILIRPAPTTTYELVCVARVMQPSGPPVFLEVDPIDWTGLSYTEELSKAPQLNAGCQISGLTEPVLQRLRKPAELPTELWLRRNGRLVFAGPLFTAQVQGESLTFNAQGALGYLRLMDVVADVVYANVDQFKVATGLIDQWQSLPYGNFGIDTANLAPSGVLRDATYLAKELHNVGQRVEELGLRQNGFDIWVDPSSRKLQLAYPQRGVDRSSGEDAIVFDERNITSPNVLMSVAPGDVGSEAFGTGTGGSTLYSTKANLNLRAQYGRSGITGTFDGVSEQATLDAHVQGLLDARAAALWVPGPDVRVTPDSDIGAYDVGDVVSYTLHSTLSATGAFRLRKRTVTVSRTGQEAVSVGFV